MPNSSFIIAIERRHLSLYKFILYEYCTSLKICDDLIKYADDEILYGNWQSRCPSISQEECREIYLSSWDRQRYYDIIYELTTFDYNAINSLSSLLTEKKCSNDQASLSFREYLKVYFTNEMTNNWQNPVHGVWRDTTNVLVPCNTDYWVKGFFHVQPMWSTTTKELSVSRCPVEMEEFSKPDLYGLLGYTNIDWNLYCPTFWKTKSLPSFSFTTLKSSISGEKDNLEHLNTRDTSNVVAEGCMVYSFGIANEWDFEDNAATSMGCEVHAFDPTIKYLKEHQSHKIPGVHFHYYGLSGHSTTDGTSIDGQVNISDEGVKDGTKNTISAVYGEHNGQMLSLGSIVSLLHHQNRTLNVLKIDCEGCEWEALHTLAIESPHTLDNICNIYIELHLSVTLHMESIRQLKLLSFFYQEYIVRRGFRVYYRHLNPGYLHDRHLHPILVEAGFPPNVCCYELALYQPNCR